MPTRRGGGSRRKEEIRRLEGTEPDEILSPIEPPRWDRIYQVVLSVPRGRVITYGAVAELAGMPRAARQVGYAMAALKGEDDRGVPWHRVVGKRPRGMARITILDPLHAATQRLRLEAEGVVFEGAGDISLERFGWPPREAAEGEARTKSKGRRKTGSGRRGRTAIWLVAALGAMPSCGVDDPPVAAIDAAIAIDLRQPPDLAPPVMPLITEFLASNQAGLLDEDGDRSDWIEIHNPGPGPFDLSGYHLTDSEAKPTRWAFPAPTVLEPGGYLVVFASGKDRAVAGKPLHTSFNLSKGEGCPSRGTEYLALTSPRGVVVPPAWKPFPTQLSDISYGLLAPDAKSSSVFFARPTPGAPNQAADAMAERVTIDPPSRTFAIDTPLTVRLSVDSPTATIRYTVNRSRPIGVAGRIGTFTADAATDVCTMTAHGLQSGELVRVSGPAPLVPSVNYFVLALDADRFKLAIAPAGPAINLIAGGTFELRRDAVTGTASTTDTITATVAHPFFGGDAVEVSSTGTLPGGLTAGTTYYIIVVSSNSFRLSQSPAQSTTVDITSAGSGPFTIYRIPSPIYSAASPLRITQSTRVRARAFEPGRPDGPIAGEMYFALDAAAQAFGSNLPVIVSHTWNTRMDNNVVVDGYVMIFEPGQPDGRARLVNPPDLAAPCTLERRGSSTGGEPKYSMAVELQDEDGIDRTCTPLGMPADSDWILHAPYRYDRAMMRNDLIYRISNDAGRYAVRTRLVEHLHNVQSLPAAIEGATNATDYFGVYSFMEKITRGPDRVDVENLTIADNTTPAVQGGYLFKADRLDTGEVGIRPLPGQSFGSVGTGGAGSNILAWVNPREASRDPFKVVTAAQSDWLRGYIGEAWAVLSGGSSTNPTYGYAKYWDVDAVIDHHIFNVATKNPDAFRLSAYWYKPRFGKLTAGPIWDFDRAEGSTDGRDFDWGTWPAGSMDFFAYPWYKEMFADPNFRQAWIDRLHGLRQGPLSTAAVHARIDDFAAQLNPGDAADTPAKRSIARWPTSAPRAATSNTSITNNLFNGTYNGEIAWLKYWWERHLAFLDGQLTRPAVASLPPGKVPPGSTVTLSSPSQTLPGVKIYYTTDGTDPRSRAPAGTPAPGAVEYKAPIAITPPVRLFVRTFNPAPPASPVMTGWSAPTVLDYN